VQTLGRAGSPGEKGGQLSGGTRFSGDDGRVSFRCNLEGPLREAGPIGGIARGATTANAFSR
jgi:hypothetical protein